MADALAVHELRKRYGANEALKGVDLTVGEGELVGLLGPNGAGKSTLVKIACGLVVQTSGTAQVVGEPAGSHRRQPQARLPGRAVPLPGLAERGRAAAAAPEAQRLARRRGRAARAARARRARRGAGPARRADVEGHAAAARDRAGDARRPEAADAGRADERARPGRPAHGPRAARDAARPRRRGAAELAPAERGRARVRPRDHDRARRGGRGGHARGALARGRGGGHDRARRAAASRRPRARTCRGSCASWSPRARTSTRSASLRSSLEDMYLELVGGR